MERGYYNKNGEDFYRYLDTNLEIQQPVDFDKDGFAVVTARPIGSADHLDRYVLGRDGDSIGIDPIHKGRVLETKDSLVYYDNGVIMSAVPTFNVISVREDNIVYAQAEFIKDKLRRFDSFGWDKRDKEQLTRYLMHPVTEKLVYDVAEQYFGMFEEFNNGDQSFVQRAEKLNKTLADLKAGGEAELEEKIAQVESAEKSPSAE